MDNKRDEYIKINNDNEKSDEIKFETVNVINDQIIDQNDNYENLITSQKIKTEEFRHEATEYLVGEQAKSFKNLIDVSSELDYEGIGLRHVALCEAMGRICSRLASLEEQQRQDTEQIREEKELIISYLPEIAAKIGETAIRLEQNMPVWVKIQELKNEKCQLDSELIESEKMIDNFGLWIMPSLFPSQNLYSRPMEQANPTNESHIDRFVTEKTAREISKEQAIEKVKRQFLGKELNASKYLSRLLAAEPGLAYSYTELAEAIYGADGRREVICVGSLISNYERGQVDVIGEVLGSVNLVLQRGERQKIDLISKKPYGRKHMIFRAVPTENVATNVQILYEDLAEPIIERWKKVEAEVTEE
jgi:hypothetical protein